MNKRSILRWISGMMLVAVIVFMWIAVSCPTLGRMVYIGNYRFGAEQWRVCYAIYIFVMVLLFAASFFVKGGSRRK